MDLIYQYTGLESLALILENKTMRFGNLCKMDDPLEKYVRILDYDPKDRHLSYVRKNFGMYCFISCWTLNSDESISMWDMYGDRKQGVRIGLPKEMFDKDYNINQESKVVKPLFDLDPERTVPEYVEVDYNRIDDPKLITENWKIEIKNLGKYKTKDWEFQKECRFRLYSVRQGKKDFVFSPSSKVDIEKMILENPSTKDYIDYKLDKNVLKSINIIIGPNMSPGKRVLLEALLKMYSIDDKQVKESKFRDFTV